MIPWTAARQASLSVTIFRSLLKLMSTESMILSKHLILCRPFLLPLIFPSIRVFSNEWVLLIRWPKCWSFSFSISPSNEYSGLISFRVDWFDLFAVQATLKHLLQHTSVEVHPQKPQSPPLSLSPSSVGQGRWLKGALKCGVGDLAGKETLGMRIQGLLQQHVRLNCLQGCFINEQDMHWPHVKSPQSLFGFKLSLLQYMCLWGIEALKQL